MRRKFVIVDYVEVRKLLCPELTTDTLTAYRCPECGQIVHICDKAKGSDKLDPQPVGSAGAGGEGDERK